MNQIILTQFNNFKEQLKKSLTNYFPENSSIAIKLHMGELGNKHYLKPEYAKVVVDVCKELNLNVFLFDSPVKYPGLRHLSTTYKLLAKKHGFNFCEVKISNDSIKVKGKHMTYEICKYLTESDGVIVLTHIKGHFCTGFDGAIKNLGMGAVTKNTKGEIHTGGEPVYIKGCTLCETCSKNCPTDNIRYDKHPYFDKNWCCGCSNCVVVCPEHAIKPKLAKFDELITDSANSALKNFKKTFFINAVVNLSEKCDCWFGKNDIIGEDIGILLGEDIIAIEKTSLDLVKKKHGKDIFKEKNHRDALLHIKEGEKLGMGKIDYKLKKFI